MDDLYSEGLGMKIVVSAKTNVSVVTYDMKDEVSLCLGTSSVKVCPAETKVVLTSWVDVLFGPLVGNGQLAQPGGMIELWSCVALSEVSGGSPVPAADPEGIGIQVFHLDAVVVRTENVM